MSDLRCRNEVKNTSNPFWNAVWVVKVQLKMQTAGFEIHYKIKFRIGGVWIGGEQM